MVSMYLPPQLKASSQTIKCEGEEIPTDERNLRMSLKPHIFLLHVVVNIMTLCNGSNATVQINSTLAWSNRLTVQYK